jgi:hypothetical protein
MSDMYTVKTKKKSSCVNPKKVELRCLATSLVAVHQVCSYKWPLVEIGPASGVIDFPYMYTVKTKKYLLVKIQKS